MKHIVFLISAFVVLLQFHSTTVTADTQDDWDEIEYNLRSYFDVIRANLKNLKRSVNRTYKKDPQLLVIPWSKIIDSTIQSLNTLKAEFSELIDNLRKTVGVKWEEIEPSIGSTVYEINQKLEEIGEDLVGAASGQKEEIDTISFNAYEEFVEKIVTGPAEIKEILISAAKDNGMPNTQQLLDEVKQSVEYRRQHFP